MSNIDAQPIEAEGKAGRLGGANQLEESLHNDQ